IPPSDAVKLVGVWIDKDLKFWEHGAAALAKGHEWLVKFRRLAKVSGGMIAKNIGRLYLGICIPGMFYNAEVALAPVRQRKRGQNRVKDGRAIVTKLASVQLKAARLIVGGMVSSPADLTNAHADLLPMNLAIDHHLQKAALRYATLLPAHPLHDAVRNTKRYGHVKSHPSPLHVLMNLYSTVEEIPAVRRRVGWKAPVEVHVAASKDEAKEWGMAEPARVKLFLDGSLIGGMVGAAGVLMVDSMVKREKGVQLGSAKRFGVFEAEGVGEVL
ncbi:hypothetical protein C8F04DRAFT_903993, partial [Mycena alexandri]